MDVRALASNATLRYLPVPKTGSEATRRFLSRFDNVTHRIGTHHNNVGLPKIEEPWHRAASVRFATVRDPVERFMSTLRAIVDGPNAHPNDKPYNWLLPRPMNRSVDELLRDKTAMHRLVDGAGSGHFLPQHRFLQTKAGCLTVHFLIEFEHLQTALPAFASWMRLPERNVQRFGSLNRPFQRVNDPVPGFHYYNTKPRTRKLLEEYYAKDLALLEQLLGSEAPCRRHLKLEHVFVCSPWCARV